MTTWKNNRNIADVSLSVDRTKAGTKSRDYMLGSFFELIKTAILDDKDDKAILIKSDPAYPVKTKYGTRIGVAETTWTSREI